MTSRVAEALVISLMEDPRAPARLPELHSVAADALKWFVGVEMQVWESLSQVCDSGPAEFRQASISAAHICLYSAWRRFLAVEEELPWSLTRGTIEESINELAAGLEPEDPVSRNSWRLHHGGHPLGMLISGVELLGHAPCTSIVTEQQHGSLAMLPRRHPDYQLSSMVMHGLWMHASRLMPSATKEENMLARMHGAIEKRVLGKSPGKAAPDKLSSWH